MLLSGVGSSTVYVLLNAFVPLFYPGYSFRSQVVSELSAIGAPTRPLWSATCLAYTVLLVLFGWSVARTAVSRPTRVAGLAILVQGLIGPFWPPMHQREVLAAGGGTLTDTLHIVFTAVWGLLAMVIMVVSATALGRGFRVFTALCLVGLIVFGAMTGAESPNLQSNGPTPWIGVWERLNIGVFMLWTACYAISLARQIPEPGATRSQT